MSLLLVVLLAVVALVSTLVLLKILMTSSDQWFEGEYLEEDLRALEALENSREKLVRQLRDLELDYSMNKVSQEDYETYKTRFERQAVAIAKRIDQLMGGREWNRRVESLLEERCVKNSELIDSTEILEETACDEKSADSKSEEEGVAPVADEKMSEEVDLLVCECGEKINRDDNFCRSCGKRTIFAENKEASDSSVDSIKGEEG